jgi:DNA primase
MNELNKILRAKLKKGSPELEKNLEVISPEQISAEPQLDFDPDSAEYQEKEIIRLLLLYGQDIIHLKLSNSEGEDVPVSVADYVVHDITHDEMEFENAVFKSIFNEYIKGMETDTIPSRSSFLSHSNQEISNMAVNLVFSPYELSENWHKNNIMVTTEETRLHMHVMLSLHAFKSRKLDKMMTVTRKKLSLAITPEEQGILMKTFQELKKQSIRINKEGLGRIITH